MASRYPATKVLDYCYNPVRLVHNGVVDFVPCGKCDGCLLHSANEWAMRLGCEIEDNKLALFFTLTYSNKYLPTFRYVGVSPDSKYPMSVYTCLHSENIRCCGHDELNSNIDVPRKEKFITFELPLWFKGVKATNYNCDVDYFPYSSKRDFQLYLKLLRKDLDEKFENGFFSEVRSKEETRFRYYGISEYGETLLRPHIHAVVLPCNSQVADYLCYEGLFKNWSMCREDMFKQYCHFADSGCRGYITQYLTMSSNLPQVYKDNRIKPWRLSSKGYAIGYNHFDEKEVFENIVCGIDVYSKSVSRLDEHYLLRYPKDFGNRLFPKCFEYRKKDFSGLYRLYSVLWFLKYSPRWGYYPEYYRLRLSETVNPADVSASRACLKACELMHWHPHTYVYALDMYWYKNSMAALRFWYEWQISQDDPMEVFRSYTNLSEYISQLQARTISEYRYYVLDMFCRGLRFTADSLLYCKLSDLFSVVDSDYTSEVSDILADMVKMPKFNEKFGLSPNSVY